MSHFMSRKRFCQFVQAISLLAIVTGVVLPFNTGLVYGAQADGGRRTEMVAIAAGYDHALALKADGSVVAWGSNGYNQTEVPAEATSGVVAVAAGDDHSLALKANGTVVAWGYSGAIDVPDGLSDVISITGGGDHSLALKANGAVAAWGKNSDGQATVPTEAESGVVAIAAGTNHSLALKTDGTVVAWGENDYGQTDVPTEAGSDVVALAAGTAHSLALKADGTIVAWGANDYGQTDVPTEARSDVVKIAAGAYHSLAMKADGSVVAWGYNYYDQTEVPAEAQTGVVAIAAGGNHSLAVRSDGSVAAWGDRFSDDTKAPDDVVVPVKTKRIAASQYYSLAVKPDGSVVAWGSNEYGQTEVPAEAQSGVVAIAAGQFHALALKANGSIVGWGDNAEGQRRVPAEAQSNVVAIAAGDIHSMALKADGAVVAWGWRLFGQTTVPEAAQSGVVAIAAGLGHSLALKADGSVVAWGNNRGGQATVPAEALSGVVAIAAGGSQSLALKADGSVVAWGDGANVIAPVPAEARSGVIAIASGIRDYLALKTDGSVVAWGWGGTTVPEEVQSGVVAIEAGFDHFLAVKADGSVVVWGGNFRGQTNVPDSLRSRHTITFDKNGGDTEASPTAMTVVHGRHVEALPTPPTLAGHMFTGWNTAEDGSGDPFDASTSVTSDLMVYAQWTENMYTVTFNSNGGDTEASPATMAVAHGETVATLPTPPTLAGHTFTGWNTAEDGSGDPFDASTSVTSDLMVYAQWTENKYTVTFNSNGGDTEASPATMAVAHGANVGTLPTPPTLAGHTFTGWNTAEDGSGDPFDASTSVTSDLMVYAQWTTVPTYTVTYNGNGNTGGSVPSDSTHYLQGATVTVMSNTGSLTRAGYTFAGWNTREDGQGTSYTAGASFAMGTEDVILYAQWTLNSGGGWYFPAPSCDAKVISSNGQLTLPACRAGEVSLGNDFTVIIPADATDQELSLSIEKVLNPEQLVADQDRLVSPIYEITQNTPTNFKKPLTLILAFDSSGLKADEVPSVFQYDEAKKWVELAGGKVEGQRIAVEVEQLARFAVFAVDKAGAAPGQDPSHPEIRFSDIAGHWAESRIKQAVAAGIVAGYPDGTFRPGKSVTRAEFTVMLASALKLDGTGGALHFNDQDKIGAWAARAVALAVEAGIVNGYADGSFRPDAYITRAEMASMIAKALKLSLEANAQTGFADNEAIPNWARGAVEAVRELGIVSGRGNNQFVPNETATRAEAVVMLLRMLERNDTN